MAQPTSRRAFLQAAPLAAAAAALPFAPAGLHAETAAAAPPVPFELFSADKLADALKQVQANPGNDNLFADPALPFTIVLTTEDNHAAKEFEWHEGRDHILQVLDGTTTYELGGTPQGAHNNRLPSEWLAPSSSGATKMVLHKGDMLLIPRGTPHKRTTEGSVTFYLISTTGK